MTVKPVNTAPGTTEDMPTALRDLALNDQGLDTRLTAVEGTLAPLPGNLTAEVNRATAAEQGVSNNLTAETNRAKAAEALLAPLASPALTGTPTAPTAAAGTSTTQIATTAFVTSAVSGGGVAAVLYNSGQSLTLVQQSTARGNIAAAASGANTDITSLAGPALGAATAATAPIGNNSAQVANTAFVTASFAPLASPAFSGAPTAPTPVAGDNSTKLATTAYADRSAAASVSGLAGMVAAFAMTTPPAGWLKANGAAVSRATYAALFAVIGTTFGIGDGSTTFNLPDLRGYVPRGFDDGRGVDSGRAFGSSQADLLGAHAHNFVLNGNIVGTLTTSPNSSASYAPSFVQGDGTPYYNVSIQSSGGAETRMKNVALLFCIKF